MAGGSQTEVADERPDVVFIEGVGVEQAEIAQRAMPPWFGWAAASAVALAVLVAAVVVGSTLRSNDDDAAPATTSLPPATTLPPSTPRTTLPQATLDLDVDGAALPRARPAATVLSLTTASGQLLELDVTTGATSFTDLAEDVTGAELHQVGDRFAVFDQGRVLRLDVDGSLVELAERVDSIHLAYGPSAVVTAQRDADGIVARVIGLDGVFRGGVRLPGEATVRGGWSDRVVVELNGSVFLSGSDRAEAVEVARGRVLAIGDDQLVRVECADLFGCEIVSGTFAEPDGTRVPVPSLVAPTDAATWGMNAQLSPDGTQVAFYVLHGNGSVRGVMRVDLTDGSWVHSPETAAEVGHFAWAPDSRFILYGFSHDVMVWDTMAPEGALPSGRILLGFELGDLTLR